MEATAAGIAFVQISTDIVKCVVKAHQLWKEVKNLPEEVEGMLSELEVFGSMFEEIQEQLEADTSSLIRDDAPIKRSLKLARLAHSGLNDMIKDMEKQILSMKGLKKKAAMVRITMKKDTLDQHQQRLSRTVKFLQLAITSHQLVLTSRSPELISKRVTTDLMPYFAHQKTAKAAVDVHKEHVIEDDRNAKGKGLVLRSKKAMLSRGEYAPSKLGRLTWSRTQGTGAWQVYIQWPSWLSESIYEIESNPTFGGCLYNFRTYNIVPSNAEIITKVENGDTDGVLELFKTRKASPFDRSEQGSSLLIYAVTNAHYETCKLLLRVGLHESLYDTDGGDALVVTAIRSDEVDRQASFENDKPVNKYSPIVELFNSYLEEPDTSMILRLFECWKDYSYGSYLAKFQHDFLPTLYTGSPRFRFEAFRLGSFHMRKAHDPLKFLTNRRTVTLEEVNLSTRECLSIVHTAALALGIRWPDEVLNPLAPKGFPVPDVYTEAWSEMAQTITSVAGRDSLHSVETVIPWDVYQVPIWRGTPLVSVIGGALCHISPDIAFFKWDMVFQRTLQQWILDLQVAGVDLAEYGRREALALRDEVRGALDADAIEASRNQIRNVMTDEMKPSRVREVERGRWTENHWIPIRLMGLVVGPRPEDWRIDWVPEFEWMAREFWKLIEKESIVMPGSWVE